MSRVDPDRTPSGRQTGEPAVSRAGTLALLVAALTLASEPGCREVAPEFRCERTEQCLTLEGQGRCELDGHCSLADPSCSSGYRYLDASAARGGQCVARVLWSADLEEGTLADWWSPATTPGADGITWTQANAQVTASDEQAHGGSFAVRLQMDSTGDVEAGAALARLREGRSHPEAYYSIWYFLPQAVALGQQLSWWVLMGFSSDVNGNGVSLLTLQVDEDAAGERYLELAAKRCDSSEVAYHEQRVAPLPTGRWFRLEAYLRQSTAGQGRLIVWQDGVTLFDRDQLTTRCPDAGGENYWAVFNEGRHQQPAAVTTFLDDAVISLDRVSAD